MIEALPFQLNMQTLVMTLGLMNRLMSAADDRGSAISVEHANTSDDTGADEQVDVSGIAGRIAEEGEHESSWQETEVSSGATFEAEVNKDGTVTEEEEVETLPSSGYSVTGGDLPSIEIGGGDEDGDGFSSSSYSKTTTSWGGEAEEEEDETTRTKRTTTT